MQFLKNLPALLKQHYEKVLLALAFIALGTTVWLLYVKVQEESEKLSKYVVGIQKKNTKEIPTMDFSRQQAALKNFKNAPTINLSAPHHLFNPVKWQRRPDGTLLKIEKGTEVGPNALRIAKITPLLLIVTLEKVAIPGYYMSVTREASTNAALRKKLPPTYVKPNDKDRPGAAGTFLLKDIKGAPEKPEELVIELADTGERGVLSKDKPFQRVDGFKVDFSYPPESWSKKELRVNDPISVGGEDYIIVDIKATEAVLSGRNLKKYTIR